MTEVDDITRAWIRNVSDERAVENGCRFNVDRGAYAVWWIERICKLYEGSQAGDQMTLHGCHECDYGLPQAVEFDEYPEDVCRERARRHCECVAAGHSVDWQYECLMRIFGWVQHSEHWGEWIRRFRTASIYISKKNKKSPTLAAIGLYLLAGDGEPGQHVYLAAKDGAQARDNTAKHTLEMLDQSPELLSECSINKNLMQITHEPTRSNMKPLSSSNARTQKSKEGLNGSVLIDETHVVDREFVDRISRAGISRKEPLHAEFSTAGTDPDSYGKEQFDLGLKVLSGEETIQDMFVAIYAAPQELKDADLAADPLKYGRMANPAMGHTVNPDEFLTDYEKSKSSLAKLATFKMYRLNIWQNSASPWLPMEKWDLGCREYTESDLIGRECWAALDLSSVTDFTALCLAFPEGDETFRFLWYFWLPEETAQKMQSVVDILRFKSDPRTSLFLTPGGRIDYGYIRSQFRELSSKFQIKELAYDDWNAEQTTSELSEGVRDSNGRVIEPGTGIPRINFSQGMRTMNEPTKQFEARVIDAKILHNGDPLARWMANNATVKPDVNGNYKPLKPKDGTKKIDGVIVAIMAMARAMLGESAVWNYQPGSLAC